MRSGFHACVRRGAVAGALLAACCPWLAGCGPNTFVSREQSVEVDQDRRIKTGMSHEQVTRLLGAAQCTNWFEGGRPVFGPIHFGDVPRSVKIEIWNYPVPHGLLEIYFLDTSNAVWHTAFVGKNIVF